MKKKILWILSISLFLVIIFISCRFIQIREINILGEIYELDLSITFKDALFVIGGIIVFASTNAFFNFSKEGRGVKAKKIILEKEYEIEIKREKENNYRKERERILNKKEEYISELKKTAEKDVNGYSKDGGIDIFFEKKKRLFIEIIEFLKSNGIEDISFTKQYIVDEPYIISPAKDGGWNKVSKISLKLIEKLMRIK